MLISSHVHHDDNQETVPMLFFENICLVSYDIQTQHLKDTKKERS